MFFCLRNLAYPKLINSINSKLFSFLADATTDCRRRRRMSIPQFDEENCSMNSTKCRTSMEGFGCCCRRVFRMVNEAEARRDTFRCFRESFCCRIYDRFHCTPRSQLRQASRQSSFECIDEFTYKSQNLGQLRRKRNFPGFCLFLIHKNIRLVEEEE